MAKEKYEAIVASKENSMREIIGQKKAIQDELKIVLREMGEKERTKKKHFDVKTSMLVKSIRDDKQHSEKTLKTIL